MNYLVENGQKKVIIIINKNILLFNLLKESVLIGANF